ncbi:M50 family metallopeptidase [Alteribacillus bidgolensis]|uniref:Peptidase M50B-like n=1 Tax=Alteribacillus bidgolensis TaxID=930129 RepID=A0A1G8CNM8_9BACI|nr:M50 family metallopeptidase [Alteribacillus bidgolensis]SDH46994.1 Peptidase M50B-like [Alteribacillus bidgolensis]
METIFIIVVIGFLMYIPVIGPYFSLFNTLVHESGHAVTALLTGGEVKSISLFSSTEGVAATHHHRPGLILTSLSGYPFASILSVLFIYMVEKEWYLGAGISLLVLLGYNLIFWVRNLFGIFWILSILTGTYLLWYQSYVDALEYLIIGISLVLWIQAFFSCWHIFLISLKTPKHAGDASVLARLTFIPAQLWGFLFLLQGTLLFMIGCGIWFDVDLLSNWREVIQLW